MRHIMHLTPAAQSSQEGGMHIGSLMQQVIII